MAFVADTFTDTAGTALVSHTGEIGATWTRHPTTSGTEVISDANRVRSNTAATLSIYYASGVPANADYEVSGDIYVADQTGEGTGPCGRMDTAVETLYLLQGDQRDIAAKLYKGVAGSYTQLGTFAHTYANGEIVNHRLTMNGTTIAGYFNNSLVISVTDSAIASPGQAGIRMSGPNTPGDGVGMHLDNLIASHFDQLLPQAVM